MVASARACNHCPMCAGVREHGRAAVRLRLVAHPVSVPAGRRFVRDALASWQLGDLVENASLCVSELTTNAALHSTSPYFEIVMEELPGAVCISVDDQGSVPVDAVVARDDGLGDEPALSSPEAVASTGRGLMIVSAIASDWGVEQTESGKRVWARIASGDADTVRSSGQVPPPAPSTSSGGLPDGWYVVRLARCPVALSLRQDQQLDELIRELQLVDAGESAPSRELAEVIAGLLHGQAHARHMGRRLAQDAAAAGLEEIDIDMAVPAVAAQEVQQLNRAVREADALCEQRQLLTLASAADIVSLRDWMANEFRQQVEHGAAPLSYAEWLTAAGAGR